MKRKITETIEIPEQGSDDTIYHIPGMGMTTVCGWVDVIAITHNAADHPPDCPECLAIVKYCKSLKI